MIAKDRKLTFVLPYDEGRQGKIPLYWNLGLAWLFNTDRMGLAINFIGARRELTEAVLYELEQDESEALFFFCGDCHLNFLYDTPEKKRRLRALNKPILCYANESVMTGPFREFNWMKVLHALDVFDCFLTQDENDMTLFRSRGARVHFVPQFSDHTRFSVRTAWVDRPALGFFLGKTTTFGINNQIYEDRRVLIEALGDCPEFRHVQTNVDATFSPDPLIDLYNGHRVCVCLPTNNGGVTTRFFEAALCGTTILHYELPGQPESQAILKSGKNCMTYDRNNPDDLRSKLELLLRNPAMSIQLASNAYQDVLENHTIEVRLRQILRFVDEELAH